MTNGRLIALFATILVMVSVFYTNCSASKQIAQGTSNVASTTPTPAGSCTTPPCGGGVTPPANPTGLEVHEDFETWFPSNQCTNAANTSDCPPVLGATNGKALMIRRFDSACKSNTTVTSWIGGMTQFHHAAPAFGDPSGQWLLVRYHGSVNEALMTRDKQKNAVGSVTVNFHAEGTATDMISLITNANFQEISGCPGTGDAGAYGAGTVKASTTNGYYISYHPNWPGRGAGFAIVTAAGVVASSFAAYTLDDHWYSIHFARTATNYAMVISRYDNGTWTDVITKDAIPISDMQVNGQELPLGYIGFNSDSNNNVDLGDFNVSW